MVFSSDTSPFSSGVEVDRPVRVLGTSSSLRAYLILKYVKAIELKNNLTSSYVVLCPTDEDAEDLFNNLTTLSSIFEERSHHLLLFPGWEQSPYRSIALSIQTRIARLKILSSLVQDPTPKIVVTYLQAACQATLPKKAFQELSHSLKVGDEIQDPVSLSRDLLSIGYQRSDPVEDPGTFAIRGEIIDIYCASENRPFRIELFDRTIERIRYFDPVTQRTLNQDEIEKILITPAREVILNPETCSLLKQNLKTFGDEHDVPRSTRDPIISSVSPGTYSDHSDAWAPFTYQNPETFFDYLASNTLLIWDREAACLEEWKDFSQERDELFPKALQGGLILPAPHSLYPVDPSDPRSLFQKSLLYFDQFESPHGATPTSDQVIKLNAAFHWKTDKNAILNGFHTLFKRWLSDTFTLFILCPQESHLEKVRYLLENQGYRSSIRVSGPVLPEQIHLRIGDVTEGFQLDQDRLVILTQRDFLPSTKLKKGKKQPISSDASSQESNEAWKKIQTLSELEVNEPVVHTEHGIGLYRGMARLSFSGVPSDFLMIEYAQKDKLYLPVYRLNAIQKYIAVGGAVQLSRLGSNQFELAKEKAKNSARKLAVDLIQLYAERKITPGVKLSSNEEDLQDFANQFPFNETPDQLKAIDATLSDLESGQVMDRLVCGDVGYGKTEVAIRAAFQCVSAGKQVAVLVPTTILAHQHEQSFKERFKDLPFIVESVSRFKTQKAQTSVLKALEEGKVDILIGTHRLLSKDVKFRDLGLIVIDEEHRFGVEQKEKLKTLRVNTHVLTLTATPIPRTLHMALSGIRDISLMSTPPVNRLPIRTYVSKYDDSIVQKAIESELSRGGQVFYLYNRVQSINTVAEKIKELVPSATFGIAHGQMPEAELEKVILAFYQRKISILICTTIIESGLDIPSANTLLVDRADTFGLAQLYQIRGRVGRGQERAYAYLFTPAEGKVASDAKRRLEVIQKFVELGSGFHIASHDLEIRGGGDLLGPQQSGNIADVGFELFTELLDEAIQELKGKTIELSANQKEPEIKTPFASFIDESYVPDSHQRLTLYRRLSATKTFSEIDDLEVELKERFGPLPSETHNLLWIIRIKVVLAQAGLETLTVGTNKISFTAGPKARLDSAKAIALIAAYPEHYQLTPDSKFVANLSVNKASELLFELEKLVKMLTVSPAAT